MRDLRVTLVQQELTWEAPGDNRAHFDALLAQAAPETDLILLPEMFTTGFSMNALENAEAPGGETEQWLRATARRHDCAVAGSVAVREGDAVYNRLIFATPDGVRYYDKRHLFRMAGEHRRYAAGRERVIVEWRDWRIKTEVCYDLRFPAFSRNRQDYDLLINVANWPAARAGHWRALLPARAIENLACVVGVNRIGRDAKDIDYAGDSMAIDARGQVLADLGDAAAVQTVTFSAEELLAYREKFPSFLDADDFTLRLD